MKPRLCDDLNIEAIEYFKTYLLDDLKKNKLTVNNIIRTVKDFISYLEENSLDLDAKSIKKYLSFIQDSMRESSFVTRVSAIRQFTNWLDIKNNPFLEKDFNFNRKEIDFLTEAEFENLFKDDAFNYREMIIRTFYELHASLSELANLKLQDFNQANSSFKIRNTKVKCSERLSELCKEYLKSQRQLILNQAFYSPKMDDNFFIKEYNSDKNNSKLQNMELSEIIQSYGQSLNKIKRSRVINLIKSGLPDQEINELLDLTISSFYDQFKPQQNYRLMNAYINYHPRSKKG